MGLEAARDTRNVPQIQPALQSVRLPEFGDVEIGFAMCRNRMCRNFGVLYGSDGRGGADDRYYLKFKGGEIQSVVCRYCALEISLHSALSVRPLARHFLSDSLPFADCPHDDCENHGLNVYESFKPKGSKRRGKAPYHANGPGVKCQGRRQATGERCGESISLGTPQSSGKGNPERERVVAKTLLLMRLALSLTHALGIDLNGDSFNRARVRFGRSFRDYHAYRNSFLLRRGWCGLEEKTATVLTDVLQVSMKRRGRGPARTQLLNVIVSVLRLEKTWFILAAHPHYLPKSKCPDVRELEFDREERCDLEQHWAGLRTFLDKGPVASTVKARRSAAKAASPDGGADGDADGGADGDAEAGNSKEGGGTARKREPVGRGIHPRVVDAGHHGQMMASPYAEVAHFLVVQRMLSRCKRVFYYMDASYHLTGSAMVAMREDIRSGRVQVAVMQHQKVRKRDDRPQRMRQLPRERALPLAYAEMEERFAKRLKEFRQNQPDPSQEPLLDAVLGAEDATDRRARAILWRRAPEGAQSKEGGFAWLTFPRDTQQFKNCRALWLTRGPDDALEHGEELLLPVTLQSVDSACRSLRKRVNSFKRPDKAAAGVSYVGASSRVEYAIGELRTYLLQRNYARRPGKRWSKDRIPAAVLGLTAEDENAVDMLSLLRDFRLGVKHAREISEWMAS